MIVVCNLLGGCAIPPEDLKENSSSEEDMSYSLIWKGETKKFIINAKEGIRLNNLESGSTKAFITTFLETVRDTRWETNVALKFNPSASNFARLYLTSSSENLFNNLNGYFIQIGGSKDDIVLYRQEGDEKTELIAGRELMKGNNSPNFKIKIECDINGQWTLWTKLESENEYMMEGSAKDTSFNQSICCGICCVHTSTRARSFSFRQFKISHDVEVSTNSHEDNEEDPEKPDPNLPPSSSNKVKNTLLFNEIMYDSAPDGAEYIEFYNPADSALIISKLLLYKMKSDGKVFSTTILQNENNLGEPLIIPGKSYICFTKDIDILTHKHQVSSKPIIEISKFPSLSNEGGYLALVNKDKKLIDKCRFFNSMHSKKLIKGVSLEKSSPEQTVDNAKWHSSGSPSGGTPGFKNSKE